MTEFIDRRELHGTLPELTDEAEKFVKRNTRMATKIVGFEQVNITEYPYEAIREAITNAVCHRDYPKLCVKKPRDYTRLSQDKSVKNLQQSDQDMFFT